jgi:hypothetical protein
VNFVPSLLVSAEEMAALNLKGNDFRSDWNYSISPSGHNVER